MIDNPEIISRIEYYSTNRSSSLINFQDALIKGIATDGGLYMPSSIPLLSNSELQLFSDMSYSEIASNVLGKFLKDDIEQDILSSICRSAYNFEVGLKEVEKGLHILRLDGGPTASFKDFAARFMARVFSYFLEKENKEIIILTATSGDTGSAVANAFYGMDRIRVVILYPENEVSDLQRKQMTTLGGNISVLAVNGKFDDCQALVKRALSDEKLKGLRLSSANSINIGRLLPQIVYYFYAWSRVAGPGEKVVFSVPSGNFGNLSGGLLAARMGLPVEIFIASVNENDEFPQFLKSGSYQKVEPSRNCISSAMNVGHPSNLARIIELYGGSMDQKGAIVSIPEMDKLRKDIVSYSISDEYTRDLIKDSFKRLAIMVDPHGAVALGGLHAFKSEYNSGSKVIVLETAHPAKFADIVKECTGISPEKPASFIELENRKESYKKIDTDYRSFLNYLKSRL